MLTDFLLDDKPKNRKCRDIDLYQHILKKNENDIKRSVSLCSKTIVHYKFYF